jgi:hypothetical protein
MTAHGLGGDELVWHSRADTTPRAAVLRNCQFEGVTGLRSSIAPRRSRYSFVNPVIALLLGIGSGDEAVTQQEWLAASIVVIGVVTLVVGMRRDQPREMA